MSDLTVRILTDIRVAVRETHDLRPRVERCEREIAKLKRSRAEA